LLLENLRFHPEEEKNDDGFARQLAALCDRYVNDAFGAAHRAHASTVGITRHVRQAAAGLLMEKELAYLGRVVNDPEDPFVAILGGAKVSDKIPVINALIDRGVDKLLIGGAMAYTFLKAEGFTVGKSLVEDSMLETARQIKQRAEEKGIEFLLPTDHQVVEPPFDQGTIGIAKAVAEGADRDAIVIVGGGDSVSAVTRAGVAERITHISTGGGATLEFLAGEELPGVAALSEK
jgi:phosphoglycerate kinase